MKKLSVGDSAPVIHAMDVKGENVNLSANQFTLVTFLRYSGCQLCNMALQRLTLEHGLLQKSGCDVIAFVQSSQENIEDNIYERHETTPTFPIVADLKGDWYSIYGVPTDLTSIPKAVLSLPKWLKAVQKSGFKTGTVDGSLFMVPALFIVDKRGVVRYADYEANFYTHEQFTPIYELLTFNTDPVSIPA